MPENKYYPVIIVPGIGQSKVVETDAAGNTLRTVWPLNVNKDALLDRMKGPFMKMMFLRRDGSFLSALRETVAETADGIATNPDGSMRHKLKAVTYPYPFSECSEDEKRYIYKMAPVQGLAKLIGEENIFFFSYNSFDKPYTVAAQLREFTAMVKQRTGSDKMNFMPLSLGGAMFTAYLDAYGAGDVHRIVYFVPALAGTVTIRDVFRKNIVLDNLPALIDGMANPTLAGTLKSLLATMPEGTPRRAADAALDTALETVLTGSGAMWACLPPDAYGELAAKYLSDPAHAALKAEADRYHAAQTALPETLRSLAEQGIGIYICCCYGRKLMEALGSAESVSSDGVIDIYSASLGATAAAPGKKLAADEIKDEAYLSPEGALDASTGAFPESTWYFYDQYHDSIAYNDTALEVAYRALSDESFTSVRSDPALGQFHGRQDNRKG